MKTVFGLLLAGVFLFSCGVADAREWYEGGTLHSATAKAFSEASPNDCLATTGDWIAGTTDPIELRKLSSDQLKDVADDVMECVRKSGAEIEAVKNRKAMEVAIICMGMMKKDHPWLLSKKTGAGK